MECPDICSIILCSSCCTNEQCCGCLTHQDSKAQQQKYPNIEYYNPDVANDTVEMPEYVYNKVPLEKIFGSPQHVLVTSQPRTADSMLDPMYVTGSGISHTFSQLPETPETSRASTPDYYPTSRSGTVTPERYFITRSGTSTPDNYLHIGSNTTTPEHYPALTKPHAVHRETSSLSPTPQLESTSAKGSSPVTTESDECPEGQQLKFALYHDVQRQTLIVHLQQAVHLPRKKVYKTVGTSITMFLLPSREEIHHSGVVRGVNPYFNQVFKFNGISSEEIRQQVLVLQLYCHNQLSQETLIGTVITPLSEVELYGMDIVKEIGEGRDLLKRFVTGDLLLSMTYVSTHQVLQGILLKITNLPKRHKWGLADPYVKIYLTYQNKRIIKWKSTIKKKTLSPIFNEAFEFDVSGLNHKNIKLEIFIMDHEKFRHNDSMGVVYVGSDVPSESGVAHFNDVMTDPGHPVSYWHQLITQDEVKKRKRHRSQTL